MHGSLDFNNYEILSGLRAATNEEGLKVAAQDILSDLTESICLMQLDGQQYKFVHRSFQEFFTACFIKRLDRPLVGQAVDSIVMRSGVDSVIGMFRDMDKRSFELGWAITAIDELLALIGSGESEFVKRVFVSGAFAKCGVDLNPRLDEKAYFRLRLLSECGMGIPPISTSFRHDGFYRELGNNIPSDLTLVHFIKDITPDTIYHLLSNKTLSMMEGVGFTTTNMPDALIKTTVIAEHIACLKNGLTAAREKIVSDHVGWIEGISSLFSDPIKI